MIDARHRWCLTGTPIHNSLDDYGTLMSFLGFQPFIDKQSFDFWIASPIQKNERQGLQRLEDLVRATCLRRTKSLIEASLSLPARSERVEKVELSLKDREVYVFFKRQAARIAAGVSRFEQGSVSTVPSNTDKDRGSNLLCHINTLRLICNHGEDLLPQSALQVWQNEREKSIGDNRPNGSSTVWCGECEARPNRLEHVDLETPEKSCRCQMQEGNTDMRSGSAQHAPVLTPSAKVTALLRNLRREQSSAPGGKR